MANLHEKQKCVNLGQKVSYLGISELEFENDFVRHPRICLIENFVKK